MAMVMRQRARTILEKSSINIAIHPNEVGGIEGRELTLNLISERYVFSFPKRNGKNVTLTWRNC